MPAEPEFDKQVPAFLVKSHPYAVHHGAVGIARNLGRLNIPVYALVENRLAPLALSRYLSGYFLLNADELGPAGLLKALAAAASEIGRPAVLIPTDDEAACLIAEHAGALKRSYLLPAVPPGLPRQLANKADLYSLCNKHGMPCPQHVSLQSAADAEEFIARAIFPAVIKVPARSAALSGFRNTQVVETSSKLIAACEKAQQLKLPAIILQEYISGEDWIVHAYANQETKCFMAFTGRKLRSYPPSAGITTLGLPLSNDALVARIKDFVDATGYSGLMDIDCRLDDRDGQFKLLDFNPRVGMNFRMFEDEAGMNVVRALHLDLTGRKIYCSPMAERRLFIVEPHDLAACLDVWRKGRRKPGRLLSPFKGARELAWFNSRDPLPFLSMCIHLAAALVLRSVKLLFKPQRLFDRKPANLTQHGDAEAPPA